MPASKWVVVAVFAASTGCAVIAARDYTVPGTIPPHSKTCVAQAWPYLDATAATITGLGAVVSATILGAPAHTEDFPTSLVVGTVVIFAAIATIETVAAVRGFGEDSCPDGVIFE